MSRIDRPLLALLLASTAFLFLGWPTARALGEISSPHSPESGRVMIHVFLTSAAGLGVALRAYWLYSRNNRAAAANVIIGGVNGLSLAMAALYPLTAL